MKTVAKTLIVVGMSDFVPKFGLPPKNSPVFKLEIVVFLMVT